MNALRLLLAAAVVGAAAGRLPAQNYAPPPSQAPDAATLKTLLDRADRLSLELRSLRSRRVHAPARLSAPQARFIENRLTRRPA